MPPLLAKLRINSSLFSQRGYTRFLIGISLEPVPMEELIQIQLKLVNFWRTGTRVDSTLREGFFFLHAMSKTMVARVPSLSVLPGTKSRVSWQHVQICILGWEYCQNMPQALQDRLRLQIQSLRRDSLRRFSALRFSS